MSTFPLAVPIASCDPVCECVFCDMFVVSGWMFRWRVEVECSEAVVCSRVQ
jgi:hypothetical protein